MPGLLLSVLALAQMPAHAGGSVMLAWNKCTDKCVAGYNVYYGGASGMYTNKINASNTTNATISGLAVGTTYYFAATSYTALGMESPFSSELVVTVVNAAILAVQAVKTHGVLTAVTITANSGTPSHWTLQSSRDLKVWATVAQGTNTPVNVSVPVGNLPMQFFRLLNQ